MNCGLESVSGFRTASRCTATTPLVAISFAMSSAGTRRRKIAKAEQTHKDFGILRDKIAELKTDVVVCFSDDQLECFDFNNFPSFAVYVGEEF